MTCRPLTPCSILLFVVVAGSQMPPKPSDSDSSSVRYVDAAALTGGDGYSDVEVLTSVALQHVSAADAEARLRPKLPEGVRVSRVGAARALLIQGRGQAVTDSVKELAKIDSR